MLILLFLAFCSCNNETAFNFFKNFGDRGVYVIEKQSNFRLNEWDKVIIVFGFADDFEVGNDIVDYLKKDGGNYRCVPLK